MSYSKEVVPEPIVVDDDEFDDTFINQEEPADPNSDARLARDEDEAIDKSNILNDRTRHAKPQASNKYSEGPDEDDIPDQNE